MKTTQVRCRVTQKVFHQASLYALLLRNRRLFRVGIFVILGVLFYTFIASQGVLPLSYLPAFIASGYLIWMLILMAREELNVLHYVKNPDNDLNREYVFRIYEDGMRVDIPDKGIHNSVSFSKMVSAIEISSVFMLFLSAEQLYLLPSQALTPEQKSFLRETLGSHLGDRFYSSVLSGKKR